MFFNFKKLSTCQANIMTRGSISWLFFLSQLLLILFTLVPTFFIFVQFSPNFVSIQNDQIKKINENFIQNFIFIKIPIYFKYFFHYFYTEPNYIFGGKLLYMGDFWYIYKIGLKLV